MLEVSNGPARRSIRDKAEEGKGFKSVNDFLLRIVDSLPGARGKRQLSLQAVADHLEISREAYRDIENTEDILDCISLKQFQQLVLFLGLERELPPPDPTNTVALLQAGLASRFERNPALPPKADFDLAPFRIDLGAIDSWSFECLEYAAGLAGVSEMGVLSNLFLRNRSSGVP